MGRSPVSRPHNLSRWQPECRCLRVLLLPRFSAPSGRLADTRTELPGAAVSVHRKRAHVDISFSPQSSSGDAFPGEPEILSDADCGPDEALRPANASHEIIDLAVSRCRRVWSLQGIQGIASKQLWEHGSEGVRVIHQIQSHDLSTDGERYSCLFFCPGKGAKVSIEQDSLRVIHCVHGLCRRRGTQ